MKNVFVTGLAGMLGSNIAYSLRDKYRIVGVDTNHVNFNGVISHCFSVLETERIRQILIDEQIDVFIHCAAVTNMDECEGRPEYAYRINTQMTVDLAKICNELSIKFVFISSDAVFSGDREGLWTEEDATGPISVYGKTNRDAEIAVLGYPENLVIRTNIYGYNYRDKNSFGEWILKALIDGHELGMFYDIWFSPILVNELIPIIDLCIQKNLCGLYHICGTGSISKYDIAVEFCNVFQKYGTINRTSMKDFPFRAPRTSNMGLDNRKITQQLGISISTPRESVEAFRRLYFEGFPRKLKQGD